MLRNSHAVCDPRICRRCGAAASAAGAAGVHNDGRVHSDRIAACLAWAAAFGAGWRFARLLLGRFAGATGLGAATAKGGRAEPVILLPREDRTSAVKSKLADFSE